MKVAIVGFSGGVSSWLAARILRDEDPDRPMVLLFADTLIEDEDTYRFLDAAAENIGLPITRIADGRTPWEVFPAGADLVGECDRARPRRAGWPSVEPRPRVITPRRQPPREGQGDTKWTASRTTCCGSCSGCSSCFWS